MLVQQPKSWACMRQVQELVFDGKKDWAHVIFELSCFGSAFLVKKGGTEADEEVVRRGFISHYKTPSENRWMIPEPNANLLAVWICKNSWNGVQDMDFFEPVC